MQLEINILPLPMEDAKNVLNQVFEMEKKLRRLDNGEVLQRNIERMKEGFESLGLVYHNPINEKYDETRTDCEANISGDSVENLHVIEVIKPIIRFKKEGLNIIVQKAIVIVESLEQTQEAE
jgi:hypothetical protein